MKIFFGPKKFFRQNFFSDLKFFSVPKLFSGQNFFSDTRFCPTQKNFQTQNYFYPKINFNENDLLREKIELLYLRILELAMAKVLLKLEFDTEDQVLLLKCVIRILWNFHVCLKIYITVVSFHIFQVCLLGCFEKQKVVQIKPIMGLWLCLYLQRLQKKFQEFRGFLC